MRADIGDEFLALENPGGAAKGGRGHWRCAGLGLVVANASQPFIGWEPAGAGCCAQDAKGEGSAVGERVGLIV